MPLVLRSVKGSKITTAEADANLTYLESLATGSLPAPYAFSKNAGGELVITSGGEPIMAMDGFGMQVREGMSTGDGELHLGEMHYVGSAGDMVTIKNQSANMFMHPAYGAISPDGLTIVEQMARVHTPGIQVLYPAGGVGVGQVDYNSTFTPVVNSTFLRVLIRPDETLVSESLTLTVRNMTSGLKVSQFTFDATTVTGQPFTIPFKHPLWLRAGQTYSTTITKPNGSFLSVVSNSTGDQPYRESSYLVFADHQIFHAGNVESQVSALSGLTGANKLPASAIRDFPVMSSTVSGMAKLGTSMQINGNGELDTAVALHTHTNKAVLDLTEEAYTTVEKTKLSNITDNFKGLFASSAARNAAVPVPASGFYVLQSDTNTIWYYNGSTWVNTGTTATGDMLKSVYDPTNKNADAFSMTNMVETTGRKILTAVEREKLAKYRGHVADASAMSILAFLNQGDFCTRQDTKTVWLYDGTSWVNTGGAGLSFTVSNSPVAGQVLQATSPTVAAWATSSAGAIIGDAKFSYMTADHAGWYILDGRNVSSLSPTAQAAAAALGWTTTIQSTQGRYPLAASSTFSAGTTGGASFIAQSALPNATLSGVTGSDTGNHTHTTAGYTATGSASSEYATSATYSNVIAFESARVVVSDNGSPLGGTTDENSYLALDGPDRPISDSDTLHSHSVSVSIPSRTSGTASATHTHNFGTTSMNGGVTQTAHMPTYVARTEFVYLGL